jgi:NADH-quinone oxidoreductase subunit N
MIKKDLNASEMNGCDTCITKLKLEEIQRISEINLKLKSEEAIESACIPVPLQDTLVETISEGSLQGEVQNLPNLECSTCITELEMPRILEVNLKLTSEETAESACISVPPQDTLVETISEGSLQGEALQNLPIPPTDSVKSDYEEIIDMLNNFENCRFDQVFEIFSDAVSEVFRLVDLQLERRAEAARVKAQQIFESPDIIELKTFTLLPEYLLGVSILSILIVITWLYRKNLVLIIQKSLSEIFGILMLMVCYLYCNDLLNFLNSSMYKAILNDDLAKFAKFTISLFSAFYFITLAYSFKEQKLTSPEYTLLLGFSILGLLLVCSGNDLLTIYLSLELISLSSYVLAAFKKSQHSSESGLKYFITGSISSSFFLLGSSLLYLETNSIYLVDYTNLLFYTHNTQLETLNTNLVEIALMCLFFSLFIKMACAPFHLWSLDVYEESPTSSSFYFATITKLSLFIVLIRISFYVFCKLCFVWATLFTIIGMLSAFIGALGGVRQKKFKTLLAYSSISNMGYAFIVLGGFSDAAVWAMLVHVVIYQFSGLCIWSLLLVTKLKLEIKKYKFNKELSDLALLKKSNMSLALAFIITIFSLAGIPPLLGFIPKIYIISNVLRNNLESAAVFLALCSVIATFYYIRILKVLFFENLLVGKLYFPVLSFYSITLSFLIHSLVYTFSDIDFITTAIIGGSTSAVVEVVVDKSSVILDARVKQAKELAKLEYYLQPITVNGNGLLFYQLALFVVNYMSRSIIRDWIYSELDRKAEVISLDLLRLSGWKEPDNLIWFEEVLITATVESIASQRKAIELLVFLNGDFRTPGQPIVFKDIPVELPDSIFN